MRRLCYCCPDWVYRLIEVAGQHVGHGHVGPF